MRHCFVSDCDACRTPNVPGGKGTINGVTGFFCWPCQSDPAEEREEPCFACNGECGFEDGQRCDACKGTGTEFAIPQPMTIDDLSDMCGDDGAAEREHRQEAEGKVGDRIVVNCIFPPIPDRRFDYCATRENDEPNDNGSMFQGYGRTEHEAIDDLVSVIEDARG